MTTIDNESRHKMLGRYHLQHSNPVVQGFSQLCVHSKCQHQFSNSVEKWKFFSWKDNLEMSEINLFLMAFPGKNIFYIVILSINRKSINPQKILFLVWLPDLYPFLTMLSTGCQFFCDYKYILSLDTGQTFPKNFYCRCDGCYQHQPPSHHCSSEQIFTTPNPGFNTSVAAV